MRKPPLAAATAAVALLAAGAAQAHAHLKTSTPAAGSTGPAPSHVVLTFSEALVGRFSGFDLLGPGGAVPVKVKTEGATLDGAPGRPLAPGAYEVRWRVVSADTHRTSGRFPFTVK